MCASLTGVLATPLAAVALWCNSALLSPSAVPCWRAAKNSSNNTLFARAARLAASSSLRQAATSAANPPVASAVGPFAGAPEVHADAVGLRLLVSIGAGGTGAIGPITQTPSCPQSTNGAWLTGRSGAFHGVAGFRWSSVRRGYPPLNNKHKGKL